MRKQFNLQDWLKDKSQKVETRDGKIVHNIWSIKEPFYTNNRKAEVCALIDGEEDALVFFDGGRYLPTTKDTDNPFDLFIITPEPELSEWQTFISACLQKYGLLDCGAADRIAKECSAELLELARKELVKEGTSKNEMGTMLYDAGFEDGKAEALKDLPMWKKRDDFDYPTQFCGVVISGGQTTTLPVVIADGYEIPISELLNKLPKED